MTPMNSLSVSTTSAPRMTKTERKDPAMFMHILKFIGLLVLLHVLSAFIPFGWYVAAAIVCYGLWKVVD